SPARYPLLQERLQPRRQCRASSAMPVPGWGAAQALPAARRPALSSGTPAACRRSERLQLALTLFPPRLVLPQRPFDVLAHDRVVGLAARLQRGDGLRRRRRVPQRDRDVAQPARMAAAADRRAFRALQEFLLAPGEQLVQRRFVEPVAGAEVRLVAAPGELVPGAHQLTVVAAEDAVADQRAQFLVDAALVLDGEVGDAAPRVKPVRGGDR